MDSSSKDCWFSEKARKQDESTKAHLVRETLEQVYEDNHELNRKHEKSFLNYRDSYLSVRDMPGLSLPQARAVGSILRTPMSLNITRSFTDSFVSRFTKHRNRVMYLMKAGRRKAREQSQMLQWYMDGLDHSDNVPTKQERVDMDMTLFGMGYWFLYWDLALKRPCSEWVFGPSVMVDPVEGMHGDPRNMWNVRYISRGELMYQYPKHAEKLREMVSTESEDCEFWWRSRIYSSARDMLQVNLAVHLPSGPGAGDGVIMVTCGDLVLVEREWKYDWHPFVGCRFTQPPGEWNGVGLGAQLEGYHYEIQRVVKTIQKSHALLSHPYIWIDKRSGLAPGHFRGLSGQVMVYNQHRPYIDVPQVIHPETYAYLDKLIGYASEDVGIPSMMRTGAPPKQLRTGRAVITAGEEGTDRFGAVLRARQQACVERQSRVLDLCAEHNYQSNALSRNGMHPVKWSDMKLQRKDIALRPWGTSLMPETPQAKLELAEQFRNSGLATEVDSQMELLDDIPELDRFRSRKLAIRKLVELHVNSMLDGGPFVHPIPEVPLNRAINIAKEMYAEAVVENVPEKHLRKVRNYIKYAQELRDGVAPGQVAGAGGMPAGAAAEELDAAAMAAEGVPGAMPGGMPPPEGAAVITEGGAPPEMTAEQAAMAAMMPQGGM